MEEDLTKEKNGSNKTCMVLAYNLNASKLVQVSSKYFRGEHITTRSELCVVRTAHLIACVGCGWWGCTAVRVLITSAGQLVATGQPASGSMPSNFS